MGGATLGAVAGARTGLGLGLGRVTLGGVMSGLVGVVWRGGVGGGGRGV